MSGPALVNNAAEVSTGVQSACPRTLNTELTKAHSPYALLRLPLTFVSSSLPKPAALARDLPTRTWRYLPPAGAEPTAAPTEQDHPIVPAAELGVNRPWTRPPREGRSAALLLRATPCANTFHNLSRFRHRIMPLFRLQVMPLMKAMTSGARGSDQTLYAQYVHRPMRPQRLERDLLQGEHTEPRLQKVLGLPVPSSSKLCNGR